MENEELVARIRTGEASENMLQLWQQNQGIIHQIARKYCGMAEMEDLLQESYLGIHEAVQHYDSEQGVPFVNYAALWIRQALVRYIKANRIVKMPDNVQSLIRKRRKMESEWMTTTGRKPAEWEISRYLGVSENMVRQLEKTLRWGKLKAWMRQSVRRKRVLIMNCSQTLTAWKMPLWMVFIRKKRKWVCGPWWMSCQLIRLRYSECGSSITQPSRRRERRLEQP